MTPLRTACLALLLAGCPGPSPGGGPDLSGRPAADLSAPPDQAGPPSFDLRAPPDARTGDGPAVVVCNLGNDPLPCTMEATCTPNGATCDSAKRYCVCLTPNCTPGQDQTCNDNPAIDSLHGRCVGTGSCMCLNGYMKSPTSGKCL